MGAISASIGRVQEVVKELEEDIVLGRIYPRERLVEEQLAERFDIKRHVVRQALLELETSGLVVRSAGKGVVVVEYSAEEVDELYTLRGMLESEAARMIPCPVDDNEIVKIEALSLAYADAVERLDMQMVIRANKQFHETIYALCNNRFLTMTINKMAQRSNLVRFSSSTDAAHLVRARDEHFAIVTALKSSDRDELAALCVEHLQPSRKHYVERIRRIKGI
ncbi:MAG: GntR family transcriptional regulator [Hyphomicrobiales bacterium]|nr:MAG: GntR family transcriptional regulator [Hyphomicrobiales bacterium]